MSQPPSQPRPQSRPTSRKDPAPKLVKSAIRTLALFGVFADATRALSLGEIAARMDAPKSSCYELLQTLVHLGYIIALDGGKHYYPSRRLYELAEQINRFNPIKEKIQTQLKQLRDRTGETIIIGRLQGNSVVYTEVFDGTHTIRFTARSGDLGALHASALGKALLSTLEPTALDSLLDELDFEAFNEQTLPDKDALTANLTESRETGIYTAIGEHSTDVMALAAPVTIQGYQLAISVAGPISRVRQHADSYAMALQDTITRITS